MFLCGYDLVFGNFIKFIEYIRDNTNIKYSICYLFGSPKPRKFQLLTPNKSKERVAAHGEVFTSERAVTETFSLRFSAADSQCARVA